MLKLTMAIAQLCLISGSDSEKTTVRQKTCHAYYSTCFKLKDDHKRAFAKEHGLTIKKEHFDDVLMECMQERD